jgi:hypothetical protein
LERFFSSAEGKSMADETVVIQDADGMMGFLRTRVIYSLKKEGSPLGLISKITGQLAVPLDAQFTGDNCDRKFTLIGDNGHNYDITITDHKGAFIVDRGPYDVPPESESDSPF